MLRELKRTLTPAPTAFLQGLKYPVYKWMQDTEGKVKRTLEKAMNAVYYSPANAYTEPFVLPSTINLTPGERWCRRCGEVTSAGDPCPRCGGTDLVDPRRVLRPNEYVVVLRR